MAAGFRKNRAHPHGLGRDYGAIHFRWMGTRPRTEKTLVGYSLGRKDLKGNMFAMQGPDEEYRGRRQNFEIAQVGADGERCEVKSASMEALL